MELSGSLESFGLAPILGLLASTKTSGRVHVSAKPWSGDVFVSDGEVVAASFGIASGLGGAPTDLLRGLSALDALVLMSTGGFFIAEGAQPARRNVTLGSDELQAHLATLDNEQRAAGGTLPSLMAIPSTRAQGDPSDTDEELPISRARLNLLVAVDGHRTVADLIGEGDLLKTLLDLRWLADRGLISMSEPAGDT